MDVTRDNTLTTLYTSKTQYNADSVEWCPHEPFQNFFVCANYQLLEETPENTRNRLGCILLFSINPTRGLVLHQTINTSAVLDQKWCHNQINGFSVLGVVNSEKKIEMYKLNPNNSMLELVTIFEIQTDSEMLLLSLDWSTGKFSSQDPCIICSDSKGNWHYFRYCNGKLLLLNTSHHCHEFEAWIAAFYYWDINIIFTGGDDSLLLKFDLRTSTEPVLKNRVHEAGVTSIHSNASKEFILVTGSYDESLRHWDIRNMKIPSAVVKMPGPLWRVKWDPFSYKHVLAACMLGGAHIVDASYDDKLDIIGSYNEHKSITYGADWCHLNEDNVKAFSSNSCRIIGTCSFYDNLLCVSRF